MPPALNRARVLLFLALVIISGLLVVTGCNDSTVSPPGTVSCSDEAGSICTFAGTGRASFDGGGHTLLKSSFYWPCDLLFTSNDVLYIVDWNNHQIRRETAEGTLETVMGFAFPGDGPNEATDFTRPGVPGTECYLNHPTALLELPNGRILLTAWHNHKLREFDPDTGYEVVIAGSGAGFAGDGGSMANALFSQPSKTVQGSDGSLYILDQRNQRIRKIAPDGTITSVAGNGSMGYSGDGGPPLSATFRFPTGANPPNFPGLAIDSQDRLYISDLNNHVVRRVDWAQNLIETVVGTGVAGLGGDGGPGTTAQINTPRDLEIGPDGNLYIADELNNRIRMYDPQTGIITTVAGTGGTIINPTTKQLQGGYDGDGGKAVDAHLYRPQGLAFDREGRLYIADSYNHVIRRVNP